MKKNNPLLETIRITREQYNDFKMMEGFIYDNNHTLDYMLYQDIVMKLKEQQLLENDENATEMKKLDI
jgi:hypothetical protein